jgi:hypothetical protein
MIRESSRSFLADHSGQSTNQFFYIYAQVSTTYRYLCICVTDTSHHNSINVVLRLVCGEEPLFTAYFITDFRGLDYPVEIGEMTIPRGSSVDLHESVKVLKLQILCSLCHKL